MRLYVSITIILILGLMFVTTISADDFTADFETGDLTALVIRALCKLYSRDTSDSNDTSDTNIESKKVFKTAIITDATVEIAKKMEADIEVDSITSSRVGRLLGKMRFVTVKFCEQAAPLMSGTEL